MAIFSIIKVHMKDSCEEEGNIRCSSSRRWLTRATNVSSSPLPFFESSFSLVVCPSVLLHPHMSRRNSHTAQSFRENWSHLSFSTASLLDRSVCLLPGQTDPVITELLANVLFSFLSVFLPCANTTRKRWIRALRCRTLCETVESVTPLAQRDIWHLQGWV